MLPLGHKWVKCIERNGIKAIVNIQGEFSQPLQITSEEHSGEERKTVPLNVCLFFIQIYYILILDNFEISI